MGCDRIGESLKDPSVDMSSSRPEAALETRWGEGRAQLHPAPAEGTTSSGAGSVGDVQEGRKEWWGVGGEGERKTERGSETQRMIQRSYSPTLLRKHIIKTSSPSETSTHTKLKPNPTNRFSKSGRVQQQFPSPTGYPNQKNWFVP